MQNYKFTDETISHIAKLLQMAILTGTDIIDNLRSVILVSNKDGMLMIDPDHSENFNKNVQSMLDEADSKNNEDQGGSMSVLDTSDMGNMSFFPKAKIDIDPDNED